MPSALQLAIQQKDLNKVVKLIQQGHFQVNERDDSGQTLLHLAAHSNVEIFMEVIKIPGIDINAVDQDGSTPLHIAVENNQIQIMQQVFSPQFPFKPDITKTDNYNNSICTIAQHKGFDALEEMILTHMQIKNKLITPAAITTVINTSMLTIDDRKNDTQVATGGLTRDAAIGFENLLELFKHTHALSTFEVSEIDTIQATLSTLKRQDFKLVTDKKRAEKTWENITRPKEIILNYGFTAQHFGHAEYVKIQQNPRNGKYHFTLYNAGSETELSDLSRLLAKGVREYELDVHTIKLSQDEIKNLKAISKNDAHFAELVEDKKISHFIHLLVTRTTTKGDTEELLKQIHACLGKPIRHNQTRIQLRGNCTVYNLELLLADKLPTSLFHKFQSFYSDPKNVMHAINQLKNDPMIFNIETLPIDYNLNRIPQTKQHVNQLYKIGSHIGTLLHHAIRQGYDELALNQLKLGANPYQIFPNMTPAIFMALRAGKNKLSIEMIKQLDVKDLHQSYEGKTPLIEAIKLGRWDVVKALAEKGVSFLTEDNNHYLPFVEMLLHLNLIKDPSEKAQVALHIKAILQKLTYKMTTNMCFKICNELLKETIAPNRHENTLTLLSQTSLLSILDLGISPTILKTLPTEVIRSEFLKYADFPHQLEKFLTLKILDLNARINDEGETLLHWAISNKKFEMVKVLLKADDININQSNKAGQTALHYAVYFDSNRSAILPALLNHPKININIQDLDGDTPLHLAADYYDKGNLGQVNEFPELLILFKNHKANLSIVNKNGESILDRVHTNLDYVEVVKVINEIIPLSTLSSNKVDLKSLKDILNPTELQQAPNLLSLNLFNTQTSNKAPTEQADAKNDKEITHRRNPKSA